MESHLNSKVRLARTYKQTVRAFTAILKLHKHICSLACEISLLDISSHGIDHGPWGNILDATTEFIPMSGEYEVVTQMFIPTLAALFSRPLNCELKIN